MDSAKWDASLYDREYGFVWKHGAELIEMLSPHPGESILDLGCGTGHLSNAMAEKGAQILGIDASLAMIEQARANYPALRFEVADALQFQTSHLFDAVFSNAVLHWITEPGRMIERVFQWLKPGGRFVGEFGGQGNIRLIVGALEHALARAGMAFPEHVVFPFGGRVCRLT